MNVLLHGGVTQERAAREEMASQVGLAEEGFRWTETARGCQLVMHLSEDGGWLGLCCGWKHVHRFRSYCTGASRGPSADRYKVKDKEG